MATEDRAELLAALEWQFEMGVDEAIGEKPVDRTRLAPEPRRSQHVQVAPKRASAQAEPLPLMPTRSTSPVPVSAGNISRGENEPARAIAKAMAERCDDLEALRAAMDAFEFCDLKKGARNFVFSDGNPDARLMIVGEAPGREEDQKGFPFVGRAGRLLDRMFESIGLARSSPNPGSAIYITNVIPWRPPNNRDPTTEEVRMLMPFVERHVELADPEVIVLMGNTACGAILGRKGITRLRGHWTEALGKPVMPMFHPAALLRDGLKKRESWSDLLAIGERLSA